MKKLLLLAIITILISSCRSVKKTREAINYGNYDEAIEIATKHLRSNKTKKSNQAYVLMLEEAFKKVTVRDLEKIEFLKKEGNNANLEHIYNMYNTLNNRQESIKPLLPLPILDKHQNASFKFYEYTNEILTTKAKLSEYLYREFLLKLILSFLYNFKYNFCKNVELEIIFFMICYFLDT
jgi:hypothetical protein